LQANLPYRSCIGKSALQTVDATWLLNNRDVWIGRDVTFLMASSNRFTNQTKEYWYMGSMLASSEILKKSTATCRATGL